MISKQDKTAAQPADPENERLLFNAQGYAPIRQDYEDFYTRRMYYRIHVIMTSTLY